MLNEEHSKFRYEQSFYIRKESTYDFQRTCTCGSFTSDSRPGFRMVLGTPWQPPRLDTFMTNAVFEEPVIQAMDGDIILLASTNMCGGF